MRTLHLLRHAKTERSAAGGDHERALTPRGEEDARAVGAWCAGHGVAPDLILCSSALRTRQTLAGLLPLLPPVARIETEAALYLAEPPGLLARLRRLDAAADSVLLIGHNDGIHELAVMLAGSGDPALRATLAAKFPTAALAVLTLDLADWRALGPGAGRLAALVAPRDGAVG